MKDWRSHAHLAFRGIADRAARDKTHRFRNLFGTLTLAFLTECWSRLNRRAAPGVDRVTAWDYGRALQQNIAALVERVRQGRYRAKLVLRRYIPKGEGKQRPLGLPATEDKLLQVAVARILNAIYEQDFLPCSYGYRQGRGALDAVKELSFQLQYKPYHYLVEADIQGFFDHIDHGQLLAWLAERIDDRPFLRLVEKWLKAGIWESDAAVIHPVRGTPQGGILTPPTILHT